MDSNRPPSPARVRRIGSLVNQLMARRGYAESAATSALQQTIVQVVGNSLGDSIRVGKLRSGVLQVFAADSVTLQELNFQKRSILRHIQKSMPQAQVTDLKFRIG